MADPGIDSTTKDDGGDTGPVVPTWIWNLEDLAKTGPVTWFRKRFVEFILAFVFGAAAEISGALGAMWSWLSTAVADGAAEVFGGPVFIAGGVVELALGLVSFIRGVVLAFGPAAPFVWMLLGLALTLVLYRLGKALLTLIPGGEALMTLITG